MSKLCFYNRFAYSTIQNAYTKYPQPAFTCSKLTVETLEQDVKYAQS